MTEVTQQTFIWLHYTVQSSMTYILYINKLIITIYIIDKVSSTLFYIVGENMF